jgi:hypothetical protein
MTHPNEAIKLIVEERQRELRTQYFFANQLKEIKRSQAQSNRLSLIGFLPSIKFSFLVDWLFPESNTSYQTDCEMEECQTC